VSVNLIADGHGGHRKTGENAMSNIKFYNTNDLYGDAGPFDAESKNAVVDEFFCDLLKQWADEVWISSNVDEIEETEEEWKAEYMNQMRDELVSGLVAQYHGEPRLIFDNGGGVTLQRPGFCHTYNDVKQCSDDIVSWIDDEDTSVYGSEEDAVFDPTYEQEQNGGYRVMSLAYFTSLSIDDMQEQSWSNIKQLYVALAMALLG
jgi:hypothetical protein